MQSSLVQQAATRGMNASASMVTVASSRPETIEQATARHKELVDGFSFSRKWKQRVPKQVLLTNRTLHAARKQAAAMPDAKTLASHRIPEARKRPSLHHSASVASSVASAQSGVEEPADPFTLTVDDLADLGDKLQLARILDQAQEKAQSKQSDLKRLQLRKNHVKDIKERVEALIKSYEESLKQDNSVNILIDGDNEAQMMEAGGASLFTLFDRVKDRVSANINDYLDACSDRQSLLDNLNLWFIRESSSITDPNNPLFDLFPNLLECSSDEASSGTDLNDVSEGSDEDDKDVVVAAPYSGRLLQVDDGSLDIRSRRASMLSGSSSVAEAWERNSRRKSLLSTGTLGSGPSASEVISAAVLAKRKRARDHKKRKRSAKSRVKEGSDEEEGDEFDKSFDDYRHTMTVARDRLVQIHETSVRMMSRLRDTRLIKEFDVNERELKQLRTEYVQLEAKLKETQSQLSTAQRRNIEHETKAVQLAKNLEKRKAEIAHLRDTAPVARLQNEVRDVRESSQRRIQELESALRQLELDMQGDRGRDKELASLKHINQTLQREMQTKTNAFEAEIRALKADLMVKEQRESKMRSTLVREMEEQRSRFINELEQRHTKEISRVKMEHVKELRKLEKDGSRTVDENIRVMKRAVNDQDTESLVNAVKKEYQSRMSRIQTETEREVETLKRTSKQREQLQKEEHQAAVDKLREEHKRSNEAQKKRIGELLDEAKVAAFHQRREATAMKAEIEKLREQIESQQKTIDEAKEQLHNATMLPQQLSRAASVASMYEQQQRSMGQELKRRLIQMQTTYEREIAALKASRVALGTSERAEFVQRLRAQLAELNAELMTFGSLNATDQDMLRRRPEARWAMAQSLHALRRMRDRLQDEADRNQPMADVCITTRTMADVCQQQLEALEEAYFLDDTAAVASSASVGESDSDSDGNSTGSSACIAEDGQQRVRRDKFIEQVCADTRVISQAGREVSIICRIAVSTACAAVQTSETMTAIDGLWRAARLSVCALQDDAAFADQVVLTRWSKLVVAVRLADMRREIDECQSAGSASLWKALAYAQAAMTQRYQELSQRVSSLGDERISNLTSVLHDFAGCLSVKSIPLEKRGRLSASDARPGSRVSRLQSNTSDRGIRMQDQPVPRVRRSNSFRSKPSQPASPARQRPASANAAARTTPRTASMHTVRMSPVPMQAGTTASAESRRPAGARAGQSPPHGPSQQQTANRNLARKSSSSSIMSTSSVSSVRSSTAQPSLGAPAHKSVAMRRSPRLTSRPGSRLARTASNASLTSTTSRSSSMSTRAARTPIVPRPPADAPRRRAPSSPPSDAAALSSAPLDKTAVSAAGGSVHRQAWPDSKPSSAASAAAALGSRPRAGAFADVTAAVASKSSQESSSDSDQHRAEMVKRSAVAAVLLEHAEHIRKQGSAPKADTAGTDMAGAADAEVAGVNAAPVDDPDAAEANGVCIDDEDSVDHEAARSKSDGGYRDEGYRDGQQHKQLKHHHEYQDEEDDDDEEEEEDIVESVSSPMLSVRHSGMWMQPNNGRDAQKQPVSGLDDSNEDLALGHPPALPVSDNNVGAVVRHNTIEPMDATPAPRPAARMPLRSPLRRTGSAHIGQLSRSGSLASMTTNTPAGHVEDAMATQPAASPTQSPQSPRPAEPRQRATDHSAKAKQRTAVDAAVPQSGFAAAPRRSSATARLQPKQQDRLQRLLRSADDAAAAARPATTSAAGGALASRPPRPTAPATGDVGIVHGESARIASRKLSQAIDLHRQTLRGPRIKASRRSRSKETALFPGAARDRGAVVPPGALYMKSMPAPRVRAATGGFAAARMQGRLGRSGVLRIGKRRRSSRRGIAVVVKQAAFRPSPGWEPMVPTSSNPRAPAPRPVSAVAPEEVAAAADPQRDVTQ